MIVKQLPHNSWCQWKVETKLIQDSSACILLFGEGLFSESTINSVLMMSWIQWKLRTISEMVKPQPHARQWGCGRVTPPALIHTQCCPTYPVCPQWRDAGGLTCLCRGTWGMNGRQRRRNGRYQWNCKQTTTTTTTTTSTTSSTTSSTG